MHFFLDFKTVLGDTVFFIIFTKIIAMKKLIVSVYFQIGVNVIGIPEIVTHDISKTIIGKSLFHK